MNYFKSKTRDNGESFVVLVDDVPDWVLDAVRTAHDEEFPNDWRYATCERIFASLADILCAPGTSGWVEQVGFTADSLVDVYNHDLHAWATPNRWHYIDEAATELCAGDDFAGTIRLGQFVCIEQMVHVIAEAIETAEEDYRAYVDACEAEGLTAHDRHMWEVHGCPDGPIGGAS